MTESQCVMQSLHFFAANGRARHSVVEGVVEGEVPSLDGIVGVALWWGWEVPEQADLTELQPSLLESKYSYLSEEPESLEWPEDWVRIEHERVWMWGVVTSEEAHF